MAKYLTTPFGILVDPELSLNTTTLGGQYIGFAAPVVAAVAGGGMHPLQTMYVMRRYYRSAEHGSP